MTFSFDYGTNEQVQEFFANLYIYDNHPELRDEFVADFTRVFGRSRCKLYDLMNAEGIGAPYDRALSRADDMVGFDFKTWSEEITPWMKESRLYYNKKCK